MKTKLIKFPEVKEFVEKGTYQSRAERYKIEKEFMKKKFGIVLDEKYYEAIASLDRYVRDNEIFLKDEIGKREEKKWRTPIYLQEWQWEMKKKVLNTKQLNLI